MKTDKIAESNAWHAARDEIHAAFSRHSLKIRRSGDAARKAAWERHCAEIGEINLRQFAELEVARTNRDKRIFGYVAEKMKKHAKD